MVLEKLAGLEQVEVVKPGPRIIPYDTTLYTHLPETCFGAWHYDTVTGTLEYSTEAKSPWSHKHFPGMKDQERWIAGLVFRYPDDDPLPQNAGKIYIAVYDFYLDKVPRSGKMFKDMLQKVCAVFAVPVEDVVDNRGNTLLVRTR